MKDEVSQFERKRILIDFINHETDQFDAEQRKQGWSHRALLIALATLVWLLTGQMPLTSVNWQNVGLLVFVLGLTIDLVESLSSAVSMQIRRTSEEPRFFLTSLFSIARIYMIIRLAFSIVLILIAIKLRVHVYSVSKILMLLLLGFDTVGSSFGLILSFRHIPFSKFQVKRTAPSYSLLSTALMAAALVGYYFAFAEKLSSFSSSDIKTGVLLTFIAVNIALMARWRIAPPTLASLDSIRQDLVLDKIDVDWAINQVDIALYGMRVGDVLQQEVKETLDSFNKEQRLLIKLAHTLEAAESFIPADPSSLGKPESSIQREAVQALMEEVDRYASQMRSQYGNLSKSLKRYAEKDKRITLMDKRSVGELETILNKVEIAKRELESSLAAAETQIARLRAKILFDGSKTST
ncbi:MAG TPA: hypothetical protein VEI57_02245 [Nitrospirota bacterium]|nr:hypothetical protein [Nitrospirota bacterium]